MKNAVAWVVLLFLGASGCYFVYILFSYDYAWDQMRPRVPNLIEGWWRTVAISLGALVVSVALGILLTITVRSSIAPARWLAHGFVELIRGTPLLVQILIGYYMVADAVGLESRYLAGVLLLAAFSGAYLAEIFRGGIESIPASQWEAARAIGLTETQSYQLVIVPQTIRRVLPATAGEFANLIKNSSLLSVISVGEFTLAAREANAATFSTFAAYLPLALGYLLLTLPIFFISRRLECRFRYES